MNAAYGDDRGERDLDDRLVPGQRDRAHHQIADRAAHQDPPREDEEEVDRPVGEGDRADGASSRDPDQQVEKV